MNKKHKILLPFALYEELENMDDLNPSEMKAFLMSLRRYCDSTGKDFNKVCKDLELQEPEWSGKLTPRQIEALDQACQNPYSRGVKIQFGLSIPRLDWLIVGNFYGFNSSAFKESGGLMGIKLGRVEGDFSVASCNFISMEGFPVEITGYLQANGNKFEDLKGCPQKIGGAFQLNGNRELKSLVGCPDEIKGNFIIESCTSLTSLEGSPRKVGGFMNCSYTSIKSLKGAPEEIGSELRSVSFNADDCYSLSSLEGAPVLLNTQENQDSSYGKDYTFINCPNLYSLEGLPLDRNYSVSLEKNGLRPSILKKALNVAKKTRSWIVAYLSMFTDPDFIKTGKAPKDPIREKITPDNIKKEIDENGERFVVGMKEIWKDPRIKKIMKDIDMPEERKEEASLLANLNLVGQ
jgi:hypothetical protein